MNELLNKLKIILTDLEATHGTCLLFAFFLRENAFDDWDLLVSASWLPSGRLDATKIIADAVRASFTDKEMMKLARIVVLKVTDPSLHFLQNLYNVPNGSFKEVENCSPLSHKFGFTIERAYILRCVK